MIKSMPNSNQLPLTVAEARKFLNKFNCLDIAPVLDASEKALVRQALILITKLSDYQILGICADTAEEALLAMKTYSRALGYEVPTDLPTTDGPVYIKLNGKNGLCYLDSYAGHHRGVLVSCQSYDERGINEMYGHLPLDLFA
ncbi:protein of unknown function DUF1824 [Nostoc sp. PCC 7107]|nr:protein of unknown function DUF1824 [Nostoc sp. PCC 7107]